MLQDQDDRASLLPQLVRIAEDAGAAVMAEYGLGDRGTDRRGDTVAAVRQKDDGSPVTGADIAAERVIAEGLARVNPRYPLLSEEARHAPYDERRKWTRFWLVDPLDGTREFLQRNGEFTINVALVEHGAPVLGVVHAPAFKRTYWGEAGVGAFVRDAADASAGTARPVHVADYRQADILRVVVSRSHPGPLLESFLAGLGRYERERLGSALKLCRVAEGDAHLYARLGPTMEWDVAAAHAIVREAGGTVTDLEGQELRYNKPDLHSPFFIVTGCPPFPWQPLITDAIRRAAARAC